MGTLRSPAVRRAARLRAASAALAAGVLAAVLASGCRLFQPAMPELPSAGVYVPRYNDPDTVLASMAAGIALKAQGFAAYSGALADTQDTEGERRAFRAFFDPAVLAVMPTTPPPIGGWQLAHEQQFYSYFVRVFNDPYVMQWTPDVQHPDVTVDESHKILYRHYQVQVQAASDTFTIAIGYADLYFVKKSPNKWAITRWDDRVDPAVGAQPADPNQQTFGARRLNSQGG